MDICCFVGGFRHIQFYGFGGSPKKISSTEFDAKLRNGEIEKLIVINREYVDVYLTASNTGHGVTSPDYTMTIGSLEAFERKLENTNVNIEYQTKHNYVGEIIGCSEREADYDKLVSVMQARHMNLDNYQNK